jgi:hypothetical protein
MGGVLSIINLIAIFLCFIAAILAIAFVQAWGSVIPASVLIPASWTACVILGLKGGGGLVQSMLQSEEAPLLFMIVEPFFLLGGILFGATAVFYNRGTE